MRIFIIVLILCVSHFMASAQARAFDWRNAPENPFTPDQLQHIDRHGKFFEEVLLIGDSWYDKQGNLMNHNILSNRDLASAHRATSVDRDDEGRIVAKISYNGGKSETRVYEYDENGNMLSWATIPSNKKTVYTYDDRGRVIKNVYSSDTFEYTTIFTYSNKGKTLVVDKKQTNEDGVLVNHYIKEYREGLIRSSEEVGQGKDTFSYEFDKKYNWVKRYKNGSKYVDDQRTIYYYDQVDPNDFGKVVAKVAKGNYGKYVLEASVAGIPVKTNKAGDYHLIFNPLKKEYHTLFKVDEQLIEANLGKELPLNSLGENKPLLKIMGMRFVDGLRQY